MGDKPRAILEVQRHLLFCARRLTEGIRLRIEKILYPRAEELSQSLISLTTVGYPVIYGLSLLIHRLIYRERCEIRIYRGLRYSMRDASMDDDASTYLSFKGLLL